MTSMGGFPACKLLFDKVARLVEPDASSRVKQMIRDEALTDLLVLSHGWNNDMDEAQALYDELLTNVQRLRGNVPALQQRKFGVVAVFWPSKKFADDDKIAGGAASLGAADAMIVDEMLEDLKGTFDAPDADAKLEQAKALVNRLENEPEARRRFADLVRGVIAERNDNEVDQATRFFSEDGSDLIVRLSTTGEDDVDVPDPDSGGATHIGEGLSVGEEGQAEGLGDFFDGLISGARNMLNYVTYYQMKERAGAVGARGLAPILAEIRREFPALKVHLIGHSFGGRLVSSAASAPTTGVAPICHTLMLLQAAFSHYGFSVDWDGKRHAGAFSTVVGDPARVAGPVLITCTRNDRAVGIAYALASRLAGQVAAALGDANDIYGGIGRNGAQKTGNTLNAMLLEVGGDYKSFSGGKLFNLKADRFIANHGDVRNEQVAHAVLSAIATV
jgi:hypothetical protein